MMKYRLNIMYGIPYCGIAKLMAPLIMGNETEVIKEGRKQDALISKLAKICIRPPFRTGSQLPWGCLIVSLKNWNAVGMHAAIAYANVKARCASNGVVEYMIYRLNKSHRNMQPDEARNT